MLKKVLNDWIEAAHSLAFPSFGISDLAIFLFLYALYAKKMRNESLLLNEIRILPGS